MITLKLRKTRQVPDRWEEIDREQFIRLSEVIYSFESGKIDFEEFKIMTVAAILDLRISRLKMTDTLYENLFRISEHVDFLYLLHDNPNGKEVEFRICLNRQLLDNIKGETGYLFHVNDGIIETSLVAEQYVDALSILKLYSRKHDLQTLDTLIRVLYCKAPYCKENINLVNIKKFTFKEKLAVYYNFRGILEWIRKIDKYDLIFNSAESRTSISPIGMEASLYSLAKAGYGFLNDVCKLNLFTYLDLLLSQTIDSILSLKSCGMKPTEVAEKLNLTVGQISQFIES